MSGVRLALVVALATFAFAPHALAQITSNATCLPTLQSLYNSKGQSPCLVAAYLGGVCNGGQFDVSALEPQHFYQGPSGNQVNDCQCSSVYYSLISACSVCQNATVVTWSSWIQNCHTVSVDFFPESIPVDTAVPGWAYENITIENTFDVTSALADNAPESTATNSITTATGTSSGSNGGATSTSSSGGSSSNTGAIAGGVVGGVVGIALIALVLFFFCRRRKNSSKSNENEGVTVMNHGQNSPLMNEKDFNSGMYSPGPAPHPYTPGAYDQPRLYDPNDPSTFPTSPPPQSLGTQLTGQTLTSAYPNTQMGESTSPHSPHFTGGSGPQGTYRGVAEV